MFEPCSLGCFRKIKHKQSLACSILRGLIKTKQTQKIIKKSSCRVPESSAGRRASSKNRSPKPGTNGRRRFGSVRRLSLGPGKRTGSKSVQNISSYFRDGTGHFFVLCFVCLHVCCFRCLPLALCITFFQNTLFLLTLNIYISLGR